MTPQMHGRWVRHRDRIVLLPDNPDAGEQEVGGSDEGTAIQAAIKGGTRDESRLTDLVFQQRHPERRGKPLRADERGLVAEWLDIRDRLVRPALQAVAQPPSTTSGIEADGDQTHSITCIAGLQDQGRAISFVQRYLRDLRAPEVAALHRAGLRIVSCYEVNDRDPPVAYFTKDRGRFDGRVAFTQAQAVGQPAGTPVYFAVDTDPTRAVLDYFVGVQEGQAQFLADMRKQGKPEVAYAVGVYGASCLLEWCRAQNLATFFWQAHATAWCANANRTVWAGANIHTSGLDVPARCGSHLGHLEGWGNEGGW
jgi:hypothetical protein